MVSCRKLSTSFDSKKIVDTIRVKVASHFVVNTSDMKENACSRGLRRT